jgi:hypothetical protein
MKAQAKILSKSTVYLYYVGLIFHPFRSYTEWRTRRDHIENRNKTFQLQLPFIVHAYLEWDVSLGDAGLEAACPRFTTLSQTPQGIRLRVMDTFCEQMVHSFSFPDNHHQRRV